MPLGFMAEDSWQMAATGPLTRVAEARWQRGRQCLGGLGASQSLGYSLLPRIIFNSKSLIDVPSLFAFFFFFFFQVRIQWSTFAQLTCTFYSG